MFTGSLLVGNLGLVPAAVDLVAGRLRGGDVADWYTEWLPGVALGFVCGSEGAGRERRFLVEREVVVGAGLEGCSGGCVGRVSMFTNRMESLPASVEAVAGGSCPCSGSAVFPEVAERSLAWYSGNTLRGKEGMGMCTVS